MLDEFKDALRVVPGALRMITYMDIEHAMEDMGSYAGKLPYRVALILETSNRPAHIQ